MYFKPHDSAQNTAAAVVCVGDLLWSRGSTPEIILTAYLISAPHRRKSIPKLVPGFAYCLISPVIFYCDL